MGGHVCVCVCLSMPHTCWTCIAFAKYADSNKNNCQQCGLDTHNGRRRQWQQTATATVMPTAMPTAATAQFLLSHFTTLALSHAFCLILHCSFNIASVAVAARSRRFIAIMLQLARNALACLRERERERGREACVRVHCLHFKLNSFKFQFLPLWVRTCVCVHVCVLAFLCALCICCFFFLSFLLFFPLLLHFSIMIERHLSFVLLFCFGLAPLWVLFAFHPTHTHYSQYFWYFSFAVSLKIIKIIPLCKATTTILTLCTYICMYVIHIISVECTPKISRKHANEAPKKC